MSFVTELNITNEQRTAIKKLAISSEFQVLKQVIEEFQQKRAYNLIAGEYSEKDLLDYRGGFKLWAKVVDLVEHAAEVIELENNEETTE